jgi:hypothetical protein
VQSEKHQRLKRRIVAEVEDRGLTSVMNETRWRRLVLAVRQLALRPAYQLKRVSVSAPYPASFDDDVAYLGDWSDDCLRPYVDIEWIRARPRLTRARGQLIVPELVDFEAEFVRVVREARVPHKIEDGSVWLFGYATNTAELSL